MSIASLPYNLSAYQTDVENIAVFYWTVPFDDWIDPTKLNWTLQLDGSCSFNSVNLKQYTKETAKAYQSGNVVKGYEIEIPRRQYDEEQTWYWRVKTEAILPGEYCYISDWSDTKIFTIRRNLTKEITESMWTNIDKHAYAKEARSTNVYDLLKSYGQELDEFNLESLRTKDENYLKSCRDSSLWDNFGKLIELPKKPEQPYCEYREILRQTLDAFMFYSARKEGIIKAIQVFTGELPLVIDEVDQYGWILDYNYIKDPDHPDIQPIIILMSFMEKGFNFHVYVYNSWGFNLDHDLIANLVRRLKPSQTVENIHYPPTKSRSHYFNMYEDWALCEQDNVDIETKRGSVILAAGETSGYIVTPVLDCGLNVAAYGELTVGEVLNSYIIAHEYSSSFDLTDWSSWEQVNPDATPIYTPVRRYLKVRATLTGTGNKPELQWMKIDYKTT